MKAVILMCTNVNFLLVKRDVHHRYVRFGGCIGASFNLLLQLGLVFQ